MSGKAIRWTASDLLRLVYVRSFSELGTGDLALAGGKGANLGELVQAGLPVPPGFVLVTSAYWAFVTESGLGPELERALAQVDEGDQHSVEAASTAIRALFERHPVPKEIAHDIGAAYDRLGGGAVAVRSSATTEDLPGASFAGQHDTYLNVVGSEQLVAAVLRCWSSLFTPRAMTYRLRQGVPSADLALAVVVQRLVPAESAGVLFTANPVTGHRGQLVIEATWGLRMVRTYGACYGVGKDIVHRDGMVKCEECGAPTTRLHGGIDETLALAELYARERKERERGPPDG